MVQNPMVSEWGTCPADFAAVGAAFFRDLFQRKNAGTLLSPDIAHRGLALGTLRVSRLVDDEAVLIPDVERLGCKALTDMGRAASSLRGLFKSLKRHGLGVEHYDCGDEGNLTLGWGGVSLMRIQHDRFRNIVSMIASGPDGLGYAVAVASYLGLTDGTDTRYLYESAVPLERVIIDVRLHLHESNKFVVQLTCDPDEFRHVRAENAVCVKTSCGLDSALVFCLVSSSYPVVFVNNRPVAMPDHLSVSTTQHIEEALHQIELLKSD